MSQLVQWMPDGTALIPPPNGRLWTFDLKTVEGRKLLYQANCGPAARLKTCIGKVIEVEHVCVRWVEDDGEHPDETGLRIRAVLVSPKGDRIVTSSPYALRGIQEAAEIMQACPPWQPPLKFRVCLQPGGNDGHDWLWLDWEG